MKTALSKTELPPSTQLRKAVFGGSLLSGKSFLGILAICAVTVLSPPDGDGDVRATFVGGVALRTAARHARVVNGSLSGWKGP
jgi:hypothetical protein